MQCDGFPSVVLREPDFGTNNAGGQCRRQGLHVTVFSPLAQSCAGLTLRTGRPAQGHCAVAPARDVERVVVDRAVQVLDWAGGAQRSVQLPGQPQALYRQHCLKYHARLGPRWRAVREANA